MLSWRLLLVASYLFSAANLGADQLHAQEALSETAAIKLFEQWSANECMFVPLGQHRVSPDTGPLTKYISALKQSGVVRVTELRRPGNVYDQLMDISRNPMSTLISVELSPQADQSQFVTRGNQLCIKSGERSFKEIVAMEPVRAMSTSWQGYFVQGLHDGNDSYLQSRVIASLGLRPRATNRKFRGTVRYDPFLKTWVVLAFDEASVDAPFETDYALEVLRRN